MVAKVKNVLTSVRISAGPISGLKASELGYWFATLPPLDKDDIAVFEQDISESLASLTHKGQEWD